MHAFFKQNRDILLMSAAFTTLIAAGGIMNRAGFMKPSVEYDASPVIANVVEKGNVEQSTSVHTMKTEKSNTSVLPESESPFWMSPMDISIVEPAQKPEKQEKTSELSSQDVPVVDPWFVPPTEKEPIVAVTPSRPMPIVESKSEQHVEPVAPKKIDPLPMDDRYVDTFGVPLPKVDIIDVVPAESKPIIAKNNGNTEKKTPPIKKANSEWIPFIYFYQKSCNRFVPDRILYVFPTVFTEPACSDCQDQAKDNSKNENKQANQMIAQESACVPCPVAQPMMYPMQSMYYTPLVPMQPVACPYQPIPYPPVVQPAMLPVYMPSMVLPSRFGHGSPRLIYPNGVIVKPKVYIPGQPLKNAVRAITP